MSNKFHEEVFKFSGNFSTIILELPADYITYCCSYFEGFDNQVLVRTHQPGKGELHLYFASEKLEFVKDVISDLNKHFSARITSIEPDMNSLETIWKNE